MLVITSYKVAFDFRIVLVLIWPLLNVLWIKRQCLEDPGKIMYIWKPNHHVF